MVVGDFNVVSSREEKLGGNPINDADVFEFNSMIQSASLVDAGYTGSKYTWINNKIRRAAIS